MSSAITKIIVSELAKKQIVKVPRHIQIKIHLWVHLVELNGLRNVARSKGLHDEPLKGSRTGQRSIRLNRSYRLIYRVIQQELLIEVLEVSKHGY